MIPYRESAEALKSRVNELEEEFKRDVSLFEVSDVACKTSEKLCE
jgi:hypothetical protein